MWESKKDAAAAVGAIDDVCFDDCAGCVDCDEDPSSFLQNSDRVVDVWVVARKMEMERSSATTKVPQSLPLLLSGSHL